MGPFSEVIARARAAHDPAELAAALAASASRSPADIAATPDDRILSTMARRIFSAGFSQAQIDARWPGFEAAFGGFSPAACAAIDDPALDALLADRRIVRNGAKIAAVRDNARFLLDLAREHGSGARFIADWPDARYVELLDVLKRRGARLGGDTGPRVLRALGKPAFILTRDVLAALVRDGVVDSPPTSRRQMAAVQEAMNRWSEETGLDLTALSRYLAWSVG